MTELRAILLAVLIVFGGGLTLWAASDVIQGKPIGTTFQTSLDRQYQ